MVPARFDRQGAGRRAASENHLRWPALDVDLSLDSIRHPEQFPHVSNR
jgi:hypothetical protein